MTHSSRPAALVTGASSGIGTEYARYLAAHGYDLLLVARRTAALDTLAHSLSSQHGVNVRNIAADLATPDGCAQIEAVFAADDAPELLVNNAGMGALGAFAESDIDAFTQLLTLNVIALTRLSHAALRSFRAHERGTLINIGSIGGLRPMPNGAVYGASKAYVLNLTRSLQLEVADLPIRVQLVMPGPVRTEFFAAAGVDESVFPAESFVSAPQLVAAAMAGLAAGETVTIPTLPDVGAWDEVARLQEELRHRAGRLGVIAERYGVDTERASQR